MDVILNINGLSLGTCLIKLKVNQLTNFLNILGYSQTTIMDLVVNIHISWLTLKDKTSKVITFEVLKNNLIFQLTQILFEEKPPVGLTGGFVLKLCFEH